METAEHTIASTEEVGAVSMSPSTSLLAAAVIEKARLVRQMFDAQAPNELLWAHDELADALDEYDAANKNNSDKSEGEKR